MRISYPLLWSRPGRQACRAQTMNSVAALARQGHELTLIMPQGPGDPDLTADDLRDYFEVEGDFRILQRPSRWAGERLIRTLIWLRQVRSDSELRAADLVYSRIPAMMAFGPLFRLPFVTDHYRPWPDDLPPIRPLVRAVSRHRRCLGFIIHSSYAAESYRRAGVEDSRILIAHNGAAPFDEVLTKAAARAKLGLPGERRIAVYAGRVNAQKGLDQILAVARIRPDVLFLLVGSEGDGPIERQAAARENVRTITWAEPGALSAWLQAADVLLIPPSRAPLQRFRNCVLPMKLFAYLAAGRPILAPASPDTAELLEHRQNALLVPPDDAEAAAAALDRLLRDGTLAERLGANARRLSGELSWDRRAERISAFLEVRLAAVAAGQRSAYSRTVTPISATISGAAQAPTGTGT